MRYLLLRQELSNNDTIMYVYMSHPPPWCHFGSDKIKSADKQFSYENIAISFLSCITGSLVFSVVNILLVGGRVFILFNLLNEVFKIKIESEFVKREDQDRMTMGGSKIFDYKYLTREHLKGFDHYKYSAIDTSPLSQYVMHPFWNTVVKFIPRWIAPNLLTFAGFLCMVASVILLLVYDYHCYASGGPPGYQRVEGDEIPRWVFTACGVLLFLAYNLDGIDGKQARRIGVSGPLGEMFDHGIDSYIVFFIPFSLFSVVGRDEFSVSAFRGYLAVVSVVLNFYVSHWEKYNTGTLYLPWGYDLSMWVSSIFFLIAGTRGAEVYKFYLFSDVTFTQGLEVAIHGTGLCTTLPIAIYNVCLSYKNGTGKMYSFIEMLRPLVSILTLTAVMTAWAVKSPNDIVEYDPRTFLLLFGTLFSNIASRLIVAEMSEQRCDLISWVLWPVIAGVGLSLWLPAVELAVLYTFMPLAILVHLHYGICVVRQMCEHFNVSCFTVPRAKKILKKRVKRS